VFLVGEPHNRGYLISRAGEEDQLGSASSITIARVGVEVFRFVKAALGSNDPFELPNKGWFHDGPSGREEKISPVQSLRGVYIQIVSENIPHEKTKK
jgi:hypothetical protein